MPCQSANSNVNRNVSGQISSISTNHNRAKTAVIHKNAAEHARNMKLLQDHCKRIGKKKIDREQTPEDIKYNDYLQVTGVSNVCQLTAPSVKLKIYPTVLPKREVERIKHASKHFNLEERLEENNRQEEEANRIRDQSNYRKNLLRKIDEEKQKAKELREKNKSVKKDIDFDKAEKLKVLDRVFMFKQEQEEEVKKANRIILNAKCSVVREAQMHEKIEIGKELKKEEIKLETQMLVNDKKNVEEDEKRADQLKINKQLYAEEIKKQLEIKESIRFLEVQRIQEETKLQNAAFKKLLTEDEIQKRIKKEKRDKLRKDLDKVRETFTFFKNMQFEQEKNDEMRVHQYMEERAERERKLQLERKITKEAVDRKKQKLFEIQQKLLLTKCNQNELALRRDQENKEREFRKKEKEKIIKRKEFEKEFAKSRKDQIIEKKQRQALAIARNEEDFKSTVEKLKEEEAKVKKMQEERLKLKEKYKKEIIQQMNQKEIERREKAQKAKNEYLAWKEKQDERDKNVKMVINSKLKALKESDLPEKYIKDVEKQLHQTLLSN